MSFESFFRECSQVFDLLCRFLPPWLATILTGFWYGFVLWAILLRLEFDHAPFRYWGI